MPYKSIDELPDSVKENIPKHAQEIYKEAFNNAWDTYSDPEKRRGDATREETAHRVAWSAVKMNMKKMRRPEIGKKKTIRCTIVLLVNWANHERT